MRRLLLCAMLALFAASAGAQSLGGSFIQYYPPAGTGGTWDGGAFTNPATGPAGCANPAYSWATDATAGLCRLASGSFQIQSAASGARGIIGVRSTQADVGFNDAGSAFTGFTFEDDKAVFYASNVPKFQLGASPGTGLLTFRGGSTDAIGRSIAAGTGISVANGDGQSGNPTASLDTAVTVVRSQGTADPPATCTAQAELYTETDTNELYYCVATNTWQLILSNATMATLTNKTFDANGTGNSLSNVDLSADVTGDLPFSSLAQASGASKLLGRGSAGGAGDFQEITLGSGLSMSGTELSATGGSGVPRPNTKRWMYISSSTGGRESAGTDSSMGTFSSQLDPTSTDGVLSRLYTAATTNAETYIETADPIYRVGRNLYFEAYAGTQQTTQQRIYIGIRDSGFDFSSDDPANNHAQFRCSSAASDTNWKCITNDGTAGGTINDSGVTCDTTYHEFAITENPGVSFVFAIDGSTVCTNSANLPTSGTNTFIGLRLRTLADVEKNPVFGYLWAEYDK